MILTGENGAGKTNLLEAVSFLAEGRGLRQARYLDANRDTQPLDNAPEARPGSSSGSSSGSSAGWAVWARVYGPNGVNEVGTGLVLAEGGSERRQVRVNGAPAKSAAVLADLVRILWLTPASDGLFVGSAGDRRLFLDRLVETTQPGHRRLINAFETAMRQRNALLGESRPDPNWLSAIEVQMAEYAISIAAARRHNVELLENVLAVHSHSAFPRAILEIDGLLESGLADAAAVDVEDEYREKLKATRGLDAAAGRTLNGPHRSDLIVFHGDHEVAARKCSTGEQKILLIGIILAHAGLVKELTAGFAPILLLDEVAAHLDARHRSALFDELGRIGGQAWLSGTDEMVFRELGATAQFLNVADGQVS